MSDPTVVSFLQLCNHHYESLFDKLLLLRAHASREAVLSWIEVMANFAAMTHSGRFADGAIENIALEIGCDLQSYRGRECKATSLIDAGSLKMTRRRILHVVTVATIIGGHTRTIVNWIRKDRDSQHSIVLTSQGSVQIPSSLYEAVSFSKGRFVSLPFSAPVVERARWLRRFALDTADFVILHLVPSDIVPIVAFADPGKVPVAMVNLADQCFWVGSSIADMVINLREISVTTNRDVRFTRNDKLLPIPICETGAGLGRLDARRELGIPESEVMLLSIGRSLKYSPSPRQNFFLTSSRILERHAEAHLYLVGVREEDHVRSPGYVYHSRMHFVGPVPDATVYQRASDVYLEGFPFGSQTALLESVLPGVPCVRVFAPATPLLATDDIALTGIVDNPRDEDEYVERASDFIRSRDNRCQTGEILRERILYYHVNEYWNQNLELIYQALEKLTHIPSPIARVTACVRPLDLAISEYHRTRFIGTNLAELVEEDIHQLMKGASILVETTRILTPTLSVSRFWQISSGIGIYIQSGSWLSCCLIGCYTEPQETDKRAQDRASKNAHTKSAGVILKRECAHAASKCLLIWSHLYFE